jgi:hypothetical protein
MEEKVKEFKEYWSEHYAFIVLDLEDYEISSFMEKYGNNVTMATNGAVDYLLSQGNADVQE